MERVTNDDLAVFFGEACLSDEDFAETGDVGAAPSDAAGEIAVLKARLLQAELKAAAIRAGIVDLDAIKLIDVASLRTNDVGELVDGAGVMRALRASKPYLFTGSSSSAAVAPRAFASEPKTAMTMSADEWRAARAELLRRR